MLSIIVAMSENRVIGHHNQIPWHLSADLKHFKRITTGHCVIMGRKTFESIGKALPNRQNIVITRQKNYQAHRTEVTHSLERALRLSKSQETFIIGGSTLYQEALPQITQIYLTLVHTTVTGDTFFPEVDWQAWEEIKREDYCADQKNPYDYSFLWIKKK